MNDKLTMPFGKHRGRTVDEVCDEDPDYVRWILENVTLEDRLFINIREVATRQGIDLD